VNQDVEGPPVWDVVAKYVSSAKTVRFEQNATVKVFGA
jgi:sulfur-oxidizing protein SoxB